jgi:hypothetical protein
MEKIASPQELISELRSLLQQAQDPSPSRVKLASELKSLAKRVAYGQIERLENIGGSKWQGWHDDDVDSLNFEYKGQKREGAEDAGLLVVIEEFDDFLSGKPTELLIQYAGGWDYEGAFGEREKTIRIRGESDLKRGLREAERLWRKWDR